MKSTHIYILLVVVLVAGLIFVRNNSDSKVAAATTVYDGFASCLAEAGVQFYGAFWCPHCQEQKRLFQNSSKIPYIECSTPDRQGQLPVCAEAGITGYPTWRFADGTEEGGVVPLATLAEKTSCELPTTN